MSVSPPKADITPTTATALDLPLDGAGVLRAQAPRRDRACRNNRRTIRISKTLFDRRAAGHRFAARLPRHAGFDALVCLSCLLADDGATWDFDYFVATL